ncbi:uncharacterized protein PHACADRAFT_204771 [Phanerochaete carnosa HHB-10118-sp]|uniref:Peptidase A1 domain-containing protein n=1 Tax=Phanerochaete carnosa (strain HHB-10118-sp) TaxID=650164 RepID=K5WQR7_PHACS|nr:uncharacterized protein PHACADRAFT_204771 [Phanerochaete carnosa HHB-10118-sp]EKM61604.1 hypothetical protein PHACADRAFT_204771 [Phanerochaete carnosa HHB-10118-sp]
MSVDVTNGELTFGRTDSSKFIGEIALRDPLTTTAPASGFWGIDESVTYGTLGISILNETVDGGATLILIATDATMRYQQATGAVFDNATGMFRLTPEQFANLQSLYFHINGTALEFTANAQIWPASERGGAINLGFVMSQTFLERFYTDTTNKRVGFATTPCTNATTN